MSDFNIAEMHQNASEFFPTKSRIGKRKISAAKAKILAAISTAAIAVTMMLNMYVDCMALDIQDSSALLNVNIINRQDDSQVGWQLQEDGRGVVDNGIIGVNKTTLQLTKLKPNTKYTVVFTTTTDGETNVLSTYSFTTGGAKPVVTPVVTPVPAGTPAPVIPPVVTPAPSPSPSPSPSPTPTPTPTPEPTPTPTPTPTPEPTPIIPEPIMGTPYVDNIWPGADSAPYGNLNFPYNMNSNGEYINEMVSLVVTYTAEEEGNEYTDSYEITPEETTNPGVTLSPEGSITSYAVLTYNRTQYDEDGNVLGVEENLTVRSDDLNIQSLFINSEWDNNIVGRDGGVTLSNVKVDENNLMTGNMTFDVGSGKYAAKNSQSLLTIPYSNPDDGYEGNLWYSITDSNGRESERRPLDFTPVTSTGADVSTTFQLNLRPLGLTAGEKYTLTIWADSAWALNGVVIGGTSGRGSIEFTAAFSPPAYIETTLESYEEPSPTDDKGNGINLRYIFTPGDAESITGLTVTDTVTWYDWETGEVIASQTKPAVQYDSTDFTDENGNEFSKENGSTQLWVRHKGTSDNANREDYDSRYNSNYYFSYKSKAELTYIMDGTTKTITTDEFVLDPAFYINDPSGNTITVDKDSIVMTENGITLTVSGNISNVHKGENTTLELLSLMLGTYYGETGIEIELDSSSVKVNDDGSVTFTDIDLTVPYGETNGDGTVTLIAYIEGVTTVETLYGSGMWLYSSTYAEATIDIPGGYTLSLAEVVPDSRHQPESNMTLGKVSLGTDDILNLETIKVYGGETVYVDFELIGTPSEIVEWIAHVQCIDATGRVTQYEEIIPNDTYTEDSPFYISVMYTVPTDISSSMELTPSWCVIEPN